MSLSDALAQRLSGPAARVLDGPIRDTIRDVLKEAGYASPAELQALRDDLRDLRARADAAEKKLGELAKTPAPAAAAPPVDVAPLLRRIEALEVDLHETQGQLVAALAKVEAAEAAANAAQSSASQAAAQAAASQAAGAQVSAPAPDPATIFRLSAVESAVANLHATEGAAEDELFHALESRVARLENTAGVTPPVTAEARGGCKVPDCKHPVRAKGLCSSHYQQFRRGTLPGFSA